MLRVLILGGEGTDWRGLRALSERQSDWKVCAETSDRRDALRLTLQTQPDVVIVDISGTDTAALALTRLLRVDAPHAGVLFLTNRDDDDSIVAALGAGARGYVMKTDGFQHVESAIAALGARRLYFCPRISAQLLDRGGPPTVLDPG
jgi:DNA-binding NarL/FixJ family response regulator